MKFTYPRLHFAIRFFVLLGLLVCILLLMTIPDMNWAWLVIFSAVFFTAITIVTFSPMLTVHEINETEIILRQGLLFTATFTFSAIESIESIQTRLWAFGLFPAGARGRIVLASGNRNLVSVKLKNRKRFGLLLWRSSKEIIIDLERPDEFVKLANEKLNV